MQWQGEEITFEIIVQGDVQGVGFRWFTRRIAQGLGLTGTVANQRDGTVRIVARGTRGSLQALLDEVRQGPDRATVSHVDVRELPLAFSGRGFEIAHE